jgi:hypothetical protein
VSSVKSGISSNQQRKVIRDPTFAKIMKSKKYIKVDASAVRKMIMDLSLLAVSMDRLGSTYYNRPQKRIVEQEKYFYKIKAFKLLARTRGILSAAYNNQSNKADIMSLEEKAEDLPYWKWPDN